MLGYGMKSALFIHIVSTATLLGGLSLMVMFLRDALRSLQLETMKDRMQKIHRWNKSMMVPVAGLALASGIYMLWQYYSLLHSSTTILPKPLWLLLKERLGTLFFVLFILFVTTYEKKLAQIINETTEVDVAQSTIRRTIHLLNFAILYMVAMIFIVTFKF